MTLEKLGKLVPITTPTEPIIMRIAEQRSQAFAVPLRYALTTRAFLNKVYILGGKRQKRHSCWT